MQRRGLTLIEMLAVVAILAVIGAIALPAVENRLEDERFIAGEKQIEAAIVMARAEAQRRGTPVALVCRGIGGVGAETGLFVEMMEEARTVERAGRFGGAVRNQRAPVEPNRKEAIESSPASTGMASAVVGAGLKITNQEPAMAAEAAGAKRDVASGGRHVPSAGDDPELVIARFMPDGTALAAGPVYLVAKTRASSFVINRWTGSAAVREIALGEQQGGGLQTVKPAEETPPASDGAGATGSSGEKSR